MKSKVFFIICFLSIIFNISSISIFPDSNNIYLKNVSFKFINYFNNLLNILSKEKKRFISIILFKKSDKHFTLYIGSYYQYNFIVDPSIGVYILDDNEFSKRFSGFIMLCKSLNKEKNIELIYNIKSLLIKKRFSFIMYGYLFKNKIKLSYN